MFRFVITPDNPEFEQFELTASMRDVVFWERTHKGRALAQITQEGRTATILFELAYSACRRQQRLPRELTEVQFMEQFEVNVAEEPKPQPLDPADVPPPATDDGQDNDPFDGFASGRAAVSRKYVEEWPPQTVMPEDVPTDPTRQGR